MPLEVLGRRRMHAALALNRLDQDCRHRPVDRTAHRIEVTPRNVPEAFGHGSERFVLGRLPRCREGGEGPPVEASEGADDGVPASATVLTGKLDGALVRLRSGVREEDLTALPARLQEQVVELHGRFGRHRVGEEVRHVQQSIELVADCFGDGGIGVPERHDGDPGEEVEVALAVGVPQFGPAAPLEHDRRRAEHRHERAVRHRCVFESVAVHVGSSRTCVLMTVHP